MSPPRCPGRARSSGGSGAPRGRSGWCSGRSAAPPPPARSRCPWRRSPPRSSRTAGDSEGTAGTAELSLAGSQTAPAAATNRSPFPTEAKPWQSCVPGGVTDPPCHLVIERCHHGPVLGLPQEPREDLRPEVTIDEPGAAQLRAPGLVRPQAPHGLREGPAGPCGHPRDPRGRRCPQGGVGLTSGGGRSGAAPGRTRPPRPPPHHSRPSAAGPASARSPRPAAESGVSVPTATGEPRERLLVTRDTGEGP